jgi:hypothetical protein
MTQCKIGKDAIAVGRSKKVSMRAARTAMLLIGMSTREALIQEILKQPEDVLRELQEYLKFLLEAQKQNSDTGASTVWPQGHFDSTAGAFANEAFDRSPQLPFEKRTDW